MTEDDFLKRITTQPSVMTGKPTIGGLRITVDQILKALAVNIRTDELLEEYPELEKEDIQACIIYAARLVEEERVYPIETS